jgi:hypothetical protein
MALEGVIHISIFIDVFIKIIFLQRVLKYLGEGSSFSTSHKGAIWTNDGSIILSQNGFIKLNPHQTNSSFLC